MAETQEAEAYPDYDSLRKAGILPVTAAGFVFLSWDLQNPLESAIYLLLDRFDPTDPREPYFKGFLPTATWHPISQAPLTEPKMSSITVNVLEFELWVDEWDEYNCRVEPGMEGCVWGEDEDGEPLLLECYSEKRPKPPPPLVVKASEKP